MQFETIEEKIIYEKLMADKKDNVMNLPNTNLSLNNITDKNENIDTYNTLRNKIVQYIDILSQTRENSSFRYIYSPRKIYGRLIVFIKKIIRKLTFWYVEPICQQQSVFNSAVTPSIGCITEITDGLLTSIVKLSNEQEKIKEQLLLINQFSEKLSELEKNQEQFNANHSELEQKYIDLSNIQQVNNEQLINEQEKMQVQLQEKQLELGQKYIDLSNIQQVSNEHLINIQDKMDKLNKLDLDIFSDKPKTVWDIGTFAQTGEDMILSFILQALGIPISKVTYLDLGANHAKDYSNTYHFYKQGVRGLLVEANPKLIPELKFYRNEDMILNRCVSEQSGETVDFFILTGDGLSTTDKNSAEECIRQNPNLKIEEVVSVETITVNEIIENHIGKTPTIMNIDIEGNEMKILKSIDFNKYRPFIIIIEMIPYTIPYMVINRDRKILDFMNSIEYYEYAFTGINSIFLDKKQLKEIERLKE